MRFEWIDPADIPQGLSTEEFVLRPLVAADVELDYAAVMDSRVQLRPWEQTGWPADDFTLEEDLADVEMLEKRHGERAAFTYTVLDPTGSTCLGCVYLMPPDAKSLTVASITPTADRAWEDCRAAVYFWVRTSALDTGLDRRLLDALRDWLADEWAVGEHVFVTNEQCEQQLQTIENAGLRRVFEIAEPDKPGLYLAYA